tara:strand:- start:1303 stop:1782 length:480 start_codon:yes stop_codon:yes gene_type:complete
MSDTKQAQLTSYLMQNKVNGVKYTPDKIKALKGMYDLDGCSEVEILQHIADGDYMVLTDEEADKVTRKYIRQMLWAFNPDFLAMHSKHPDIDEDVFKSLQDLYENANEVVFHLLNDFDEFVDEAIEAEIHGRGHYIAQYDGVEYEGTINGVDYFVYRLN